MKKGKSLKDWCIENNKEYILKEWDYSKNKDTPNDISYASHDKRYFVCEKNHSYFMSIAEKSRGYKCPICSGRQILAGYNDFATIYPELVKYWHPTKNGELTPQAIGAHSNEIIWWVCDENHEFDMRVCNFVKSKGACPICTNKRVLVGYNDLATTNPELLSEWDYEENGELLPTNFVPGSGISVAWKCSTCNYKWVVPIRKRAQCHHKCPACTNRNVNIGFNDLATTHPEMVALWHPTKNGDLKPTDVHFGYTKKIWWKCACGEEWDSLIRCAYKEKRCRVCTQREVKVGINDLATSHPELSKYWDYSKNGDLTPNKISASYSKSVWWKCENNHSWRCAVNVQVNKVHICPYCAGVRIWPGYNDFKTKHPELLKEIHPTKNNDIDWSKIASYSKVKIWWVGDCGHEWEASIAERVKGAGCQVCNNRYVSVGVNDLLTIHPGIAEDWDYEKNEGLTPQDVTAGSGKEVWWKCRCNHSKFVAVSSRVKSNGCSICNSRKSMSYPEFIIHYFLSKHDEIVHNYTELGFELDIYIPSKKIGIEYDGSYFHKNQEKKELKKDKLCVEHGITLYRIREYPLGLLNSTSINISSKNDYSSLEKTIKDLIFRIYNISVDIDISNNLENINNLRDFVEIENSLAVKNPTVAAQWHPTKNGRLTPRNVTVSSNKQAWWLCEEGHEWPAIINSRKDASCPVCNNKRLLVGFNDLATKYPEIAKEWHPTKNGKLKPTDVTYGANKKVWWKGECGHEWPAYISTRVRQKTGCPICQNLVVLTGFNDLATKAPEAVEEWHPTKNGKLKPTDIVFGSTVRVWWKCKTCGHEWNAEIRRRAIDGTGCPNCANVPKLEVGVNDLQSVCPELAAQWHPTKNGKLRPVDVRFNDKKTRVWWVNEFGRELEANIFNRYRRMAKKQLNNV